MSINSVVLAGNLTKDPDLRSTTNGTAVLLLSIAVNERTKVGGEWTDRANFFDVKMFGARAESLARYLMKGTKVAVSGKLRWESWTDENDRKKSRVLVIADDLELMQKRDSQPAQNDDEYADIPF